MKRITEIHLQGRWQQVRRTGAWSHGGDVVCGAVRSWGVKGVMGYLWLREECGENVFHTLEW